MEEGRESIAHQGKPDASTARNKDIKCFSYLQIDINMSEVRTDQFCEYFVMPRRSEERRMWDRNYIRYEIW